MRLGLVIAVALIGRSVAAYDGRIGDAMIDLRSGYAGTSLDLTQMLLPRWRSGLLVTRGWHGARTPFGLGLMLGYEGHQRGYALVPRARLGAAIGLVQDGGLGLNVQADTGFLYYLIRSAGVGVSVGGQLWGSQLYPEASLSLVGRW
jgi:hypothetical protein